MDHGLWQSHRLPDNWHAVTPDLRPTPLLAVVGANHRGRQPGGVIPLQNDCGSRPSGLWIIIAHCIALRRHNRPTFDNRTIRLYSGAYSSPSAAAFTSSVIRRSSPSTTPRRRTPNRAEYPPLPIPISRWPSSHHIPISDSDPETGVCVSLQFGVHVPMSFCPLPVSANRLVHLSRSATTLACDASHRPHLLTGQIHTPPSSSTLFPTATTNVTLCPPSRSDQRDDKHHGLPP